MSDKKLLNESTVRRFMKLAHVGTLSDNFISENYEEEELYEEAELEEEDPMADEAELDMPEGDPMADEGDLDMAEEEPADEAEVSLTQEEAEIIIDLGNRLSMALGEEGEEEMEMDADLGDVEEPPVDEPVADEPPAPEEEEEVMQEDIVNEVLKRVTKRIIRERRK